MDLEKKLEQIKPYQLNCNVFSVYDYPTSYSMQELLNKFFETINNCVELCNNVLDLAKWLVSIGLEQEVAKKLDLWLQDGTLASLINDKLLKEINDKLNKQTIHTNYYVSIEDFGAIGDYLNGEGTDNTEFINNAIEYAQNNNKYVVVPNKNYKVNGTIIFKRDTKIVSEGGYLYYGGNDVCISIKGNEKEHFYPSIKGLGIERIGRDKIGTGIDIKYSRMGGLFSDVDVVGFKIGVYHSEKSDINPGTCPLPSWSWLNNFERCKFRHNQTGITLSTNSNGVTLNNCLINNNTWYGVSVVDSTNVRILNCEFESNGDETRTNAISVAGGTGVVVDGCYFEDNGYNDLNSPVIFISGERKSNQTIITNNFFNSSGAKAIIHIGNAQTFYITGNTFYKNSDLEYDIYLSNQASTVNSVILGNTVGSKLGFESELKYGATNSFISHGDEGFLKNVFKLYGNNSKFIMEDFVNKKNIQIENLNGKMKVSNQMGTDVFIVDTVNKNCTIPIISYPNKESLPQNSSNGTLAYLLSENKIVISRDFIWRDSIGNII